MSNSCDYCDKKFGTEMPFKCKYCGGSFCSEHRLPESHDCEGLREVKEKVKRGEMPMFVRKEVAREIKPDFSSNVPYQVQPYHGNLWAKVKKFLKKLKFW